MIEKLRYNKLTRWLYKRLVKKNRVLRRAKIIVFLKSGRITEWFAEYSKDSKTLILPEKHAYMQGRNREIQILNPPIPDDATNQHIYFWVYGTQETISPIDVSKVNAPNYFQDLMLQMYQLGIIEGKGEELKMGLSKQVIILILIIFALLLGTLSLSWNNSSMIGELVDIAKGIV